MRNPNGYGSITRLSGKRRKPWIVRVTTGWTPEGEQLREVVGYYETKTEANIALANYRQNPLSIKATKMTLQNVYDEWSETRYQNISKSTQDGYKASWNYISVYKDQIFRELRTSHWQKIINDNNSMSMSTLTKIKALGTSLYAFTMANDIVDKNYMQYIEMPDREYSKKEPFTHDEVKKLWEYVEIFPWVDTILILIYTGMRISEMLKLTKFDIDLENRLITGGIKTDAGKDRVIPIHFELYPLLYNRYSNSKSEYLITYEDGKRLTADHYRKTKYYEALRAVGVRKLSPHSCRHTFGTMAAESGIAPLSIQRIIGHSDYAFTANKYTHPDVQKLILDMNKISFKSPGTSRGAVGSQQSGNK